MSGGSTMLPRILARDLADPGRQSRLLRAAAASRASWSLMLLALAVDRERGLLARELFPHALLRFVHPGLQRLGLRQRVCGSGFGRRLGFDFGDGLRLRRRRLLLDDFGLRASPARASRPRAAAPARPWARASALRPAARRRAASQSSTCTASGGRFCQRTPKTRTANSSRCTAAASRTDATLPGSARSSKIDCGGGGHCWLRLHLQADAFHALRAQVVHHLQHRFVAHVLVAGDQHRDLRILEDLRELGARRPAGR